MSDILMPDIPGTAKAEAAVATLSALAGADVTRRLIRRGLAIVVVFFVFVGGWTVTAHLDSAAVAYGAVQAEGAHKVVEHPDGGVVTAILVKEGDLVQAGQVLVKLDPVQATAALNIEISAVDTLTASLARLQAEAAGAKTKPVAAGRRTLYDPILREFSDVPVYTRSTLSPGSEVPGPAIIAEDETTTIVTSGFIAALDPSGAIRLTSKSVAATKSMGEAAQ